MPAASQFAAFTPRVGAASKGSSSGRILRQASKRSGESGQALVEFALLFPLMFLLIVNAVNFGGFLFAWITVADAARNGTYLWTLGGAAAGAPGQPTAAQVATLVSNDISSLLGRASLAVRACTNNNGTIACSGAGSTLPPPDPEPSKYVSATVDVTYSYQPLIPLWSFPRMNVYATLPVTTVHSRGVMRVLQ